MTQNLVFISGIICITSLPCEIDSSTQIKENPSILSHIHESLLIRSACYLAGNRIEVSPNSKYTCVIENGPGKIKKTVMPRS